MSDDWVRGRPNLRLHAHRSSGAHPRAAWGDPERKQDIYSHFSLVACFALFGFFFPFAEYFYSSPLAFAAEEGEAGKCNLLLLEVTAEICRAKYRRLGKHLRFGNACASERRNLALNLIPIALYIPTG